MLAIDDVQMFIFRPSQAALNDSFSLRIAKFNAKLPPQG
jgi:hypothetical protein